MNTTSNPLATLTAAEAQIVVALNAAAEQLDVVGTVRLEEALARLHASADAAKERIARTIAALTGTAGDVVGTFAVAAAEIVAALAMNKPLPVQLEALPAPITPIVDPTSAQSDGEAIIDLAAPTAGERVVFHDVTGYSTQPSQDAQQPRQTSQAAEATALPSTVQNASQEQPQATETGIDIPAALASMVSIPEVGRFVSCRHNGPNKFACQSCRAGGEAFVPPTVKQAEDLERQVLSAANGHVESNRDDRTSTRRKPRSKKSST